MTTTRTPGATTPGRRRNAHKENIYFEPGKFGRKTGITLRDTGVRDEHGFEPVSGIFSSPHRQSPARASPERLQTVHAGADAPQLGKTPRLPPRSPGPRRTNISGSPVRQSLHKAVSPTRVPLQESPVRSPNRSPSRVLTYETDRIMASVEKSPTPMKARSGLKTKSGKPRKSLFEFDLSPEKRKQKQDVAPAPASSVMGEDIDDISRVLEHNEETEDTNEQVAPIAPVAPMRTGQTSSAFSPRPIHATEEDYMPPLMDDDIPDVSPSPIQQTPSFRENTDQPNTKKKRGRPRKSGDSSILDASGDVSVAQVEETPGRGRGRPRKSDNTSIMDNSGDVSVVEDQGQGSSLKRKSGNGDDTLHAEEQVSSGKRQKTSAAEPSFVESEIGAHDSAIGGAPLDEPLEEDAPIEIVPKRKGRPSKKQKAPKTQNATKPAAHRQVTSVGRSQQPSQSSSQDTLTRGSIRLRSNTPFEDEGCTVSRYGRPSIKPLAYWKNETQVYRHGELEGVVRAHEIVAPKRVQNRTQQRKRGPLGRIAEDEEDENAEDLLPEAWEKEIRVIRGPVRRWDEEMQAGIPTKEDDEDIAFSAQSIKPHDVPDSDFRYTKVMTLKFFGSGLVEIPPNGYKKTKNVRKMQMCFFVHEGKVTVDVAGMTFGITAGGMFQVPRGNNYAITNESSVYPAKIFFAQGCEPEPEPDEEEEAEDEAEDEGAEPDSQLDSQLDAQLDTQITVEE
ncbi:hypothetical protein MBLNU457_7080t1 [Dothideomycetes sp. NU457]